LKSDLHQKSDIFLAVKGVEAVVAGPVEGAAAV
jgi:hypothetical protein